MTNPGPLGGDDRRPVDLPLVGETPPAAVPPAPAYQPSELLDPTPAYDSLAVETGLDTPTYDALIGETVDTGPLATLKTFAAGNPAAFLGAALAAGWLVGKLFFSSSDDDES